MTPPDVVPNADEPTLRRIYGEDADAIIAFSRFLRLPREEPTDEFPGGRIVCPQHWHDYGTGKISSAEVLEIDAKANA